MRILVLGLACALAACGDGGGGAGAKDAGTRMDAPMADGPRADGPRRDGGRVDAGGDATRPHCVTGAMAPVDLASGTIYVIGDARASTPVWARSWSSYLEARLATSRAVVRRLERAGASFASLAEAPELLCACAGGDCVAQPGGCLPGSVDGPPALVIFQLGTVDMLQVFLRLAQQSGQPVDPPTLLADFRAQVRAALSVVDDRSKFATRPALRVVGLVDPSDGSGDLDALVQKVFNLPLATHVAPADALRVLVAMNQVLADEAGACGGGFIDLAPAFLGHGLFFDDPANPHHVAADPSAWLNGLYGVSARGAFETWRIVAGALGAGDVGPRPTLPDPPAMLPRVPANGWAKAVVSSHITQSIMADFGVAMNTATDPTKALGPLDPNNVDAVALGVLGADLVLDLGAATRAADDTGDDLVVYEQGPMLHGIGEPYRVYGASSPNGPWNVIGDGYGEQSFDIGTAAPVQYVRIVSLATLGDVLRGPGSPFFPGGEIDAVGAVTPR